MIRFVRLLHLIAIAGLIASAGYAYSIKYDALYQAEQVAKLKSRAQRERDAIAVLKAEWQHLNRPDRLQAVVDRHLDLKPMEIHQLARLSDLPDRPPKIDEIARKLEALGLMTATPKDKRPDPRTTGSTTPKR
jgi:hypothetical protein